MSECEKSPLGRHIASFSGRCKYCGWVPPPPPSYEEMQQRLAAAEAAMSTMFTQETMIATEAERDDAHNLLRELLDNMDDGWVQRVKRKIGYE